MAELNFLAKLLVTPLRIYCTEINFFFYISLKKIASMSRSAARLNSILADAVHMQCSVI